MTGRDHLLWDIPTRVIHWSIVACLPLAWWTAEEGNMEQHAWIGYSVIVLVVTRILWGLLGSPHSRFADFLVGPGTALAYLRGAESGTPGHNPLGGWSVLVLLLLLLAQAVSGLFNSDDILFSGPLYYAAGDEFRDTMGVVHEVAFNVLLGFVGLHVAAVLFYQFRRGDKLVQAMVRGGAPGKYGRAPTTPAWRALVLAGLVAGALWTIIANAPQPTPMW